MTVPNITLNDGKTIPQLGFGVFQIDPSDTKEATLTALEVGYRHIDTAEMYGNEKEVGEAIAESGIDRSEIFVTSKLNNGFHDPEAALENGKKSADLLGGYTDLFLIHWPLPTVSDFVPTWKAMEELYRGGTARSIGVSNFQAHHLNRLAAETTITPAVNQIEVHPYLVQEELRAYDREHGIATEAWSPIALWQNQPQSSHGRPAQTVDLQLSVARSEDDRYADHGRPSEWHGLCFYSGKAPKN